MTIEEIQELVNSVEHKSRFRVDYYPRAYLMNFIREETKLSYENISKLFGKRDHACVINAIKAHKNLVETNDKEYKILTTDIKMRIKALERPKLPLESEILNCNTLKEFEEIQEKIRSDYYY
jgi:chromosomal replication initiation ATPase DnaA